MKYENERCIFSMLVFWARHKFVLNNIFYGTLFMFLFFFFFFSSCTQFQELLGTYKAIKWTNGRAHCIYRLFYYCIKYIRSVRVEYRCFVEFQVHLIFVLQNFQVYSQKCTRKYCEWGNLFNLFV